MGDKVSRIVHLLQYGKAVRICGMLLKTNTGQAKLAAAYFQHVQVSNVNIHELNADDLTTRFPMLKEAQAGGAPGWADRLVSCHFLVDCPMCELTNIDVVVCFWTGPITCMYGVV